MSRPGKTGRLVLRVIGAIIGGSVAMYGIADKADGTIILAGVALCAASIGLPWPPSPSSPP